jgi:hypothetical protein
MRPPPCTSDGSFGQHFFRFVVGYPGSKLLTIYVGKVLVSNRDL